METRRQIELLRDFLSELSLTFSVLDERRWMCFFLAQGASVEKAKQQTDAWVAECTRAGNKGTIFGLSIKGDSL